MKVIRLKKIIQISCIVTAVMVLSLFCFAGMNEAQKAAEEGKIKTIIKEVVGEIGTLSPNFISIVYERDTEQGREYEILLYIDKDVRLVHKKGLKELKPGNRVRVEYREITETTEQGEKSKRIAQKITYVGPKIKGLRTDY